MNGKAAAYAAAFAFVWGGWGPAANTPPRPHRHEYAKRWEPQQKTCFMPRPRSGEPGQMRRACYQERCACGDKQGGLICGEWSPCEPLRPTR